MADAKLLEVFDNPHPGRAYEIEHFVEEFTSVCPKTGHPDYGQIAIRYVADTLCVELKSLKLYLQSYRNDGVFYEDLTNRILNDLVEVTKPRTMIVQTNWSVRGGIRSTITASYGDDPEIGPHAFEELLDEETDDDPAPSPGRR